MPRVKNTFGFTITKAVEYNRYEIPNFSFGFGVLVINFL